MTLCGRSNHKIDSCFATRDKDGKEILSSDEEESSDDEAVNVWCCRFCSKEFTSLKGAQYHEDRWCRYRTEEAYEYETCESCYESDY